jgi:hypothetical protein
MIEELKANKELTLTIGSAVGSICGYYLAKEAGGSQLPATLIGGILGTLAVKVLIK